MTYKIAVGAGHGLNTPGKRTPDNEREWNFNNKLVLSFIETMKNYKNVEVKRFDDATGKTDVSLEKREKGAESWGADIYISFHHNALAGKWGTHTGVETHVYQSKPAGSVKLAKAVHPALVKGYGLKDRGIKYTNLYITRETNMPAILIEGGFMDSTIDIKKLRDNAVLKNTGKLIAEAVAKYASLVKKPVSTNTSTNSVITISGSTYTVKKGDTLYSIAKASGLTVAKLKEFNSLKSDVLSIGQKLSLKAKTVDSSGIKVVGTIKIVNVSNAAFIVDKPSQNSKNLATAKKGSTLHISGSVPGWWEVIHEGKRAYVNEDYGQLI